MDHNVVAFENPFYAGGTDSKPVTALHQPSYDNNGGDLYDEPAFNTSTQKQNPLFNGDTQPTYDGGDYGDYGQPTYVDDYNIPENYGSSEYNHMGTDGAMQESTYGDDVGAAASSQPLYVSYISRLDIPLLDHKVRKRG